MTSSGLHQWHPLPSSEEMLGYLPLRPHSVFTVLSGSQVLRAVSGPFSLVQGLQVSSPIVGVGECGVCWELCDSEAVAEPAPL